LAPRFATPLAGASQLQHHQRHLHLLSAGSRHREPSSRCLVNLALQCGELGATGFQVQMQYKLRVKKPPLSGWLGRLATIVPPAVFQVLTVVHCRQGLPLTARYHCDQWGHHKHLPHLHQSGVLAGMAPVVADFCCGPAASSGTTHRQAPPHIPVEACAAPSVGHAVGRAQCVSPALLQPRRKPSCACGLARVSPPQPSQG